MFLKYINRQLWGKCGEKLDNPKIRKQSQWQSQLQ